jgi:hypothetical protein
MGKVPQDDDGVDLGYESEEEIREAVRRRRDQLFRSGWRNQRELTPLVSRAEDNTFRFLIEWCEEFETVLGRQRERLSDPTPRTK